MIEKGVQKSYLLDTYSARKLGRECTGSANRGVGSRPSVALSKLSAGPSLGLKVRVGRAGS